MTLFWRGIGATYGGNLAAYTALLALAITIGCGNLSNSGPLWPDAPQYANAGAMIHDWLRSGKLLRPYEFAKQNYARFPAFHIPYHPPAYPGLLGLFFAATGVSYYSARIFIALCLWISGCFFYEILKRTGVTKSVSFGCSSLLLTIPEIAFWSRDTMSEIPAFALIMAGSYFFLLWLETNSPAAYVAAFCLAEVAFLSRYLTAGILPAWFLWAFLARKHRKLVSIAGLLPPAIYLILNTIWILFVITLSKYESPYGSAPPKTNYADFFSLEIASFYFAEMPTMAGKLTLIAAFIGLVYSLGSRKQDAFKFFWLSWLIGYSFLVLIVGIYEERRYFIFALPSFVGLIARLFSSDAGPPRIRTYLAPILLGLCFLENVNTLRSFPQGVVGYEKIGERLARLDERGNILVSSILHSDLIFRYRSNQPVLNRSFIRGDRSLTIRLSDYADAPVIVIAQNSADVLEIVRRGRIRYVVTFAPNGGNKDLRTKEMILLHEVMQSETASFILDGSFPLRIQLDKAGQINQLGQVFLWRFKGEVLEGPSELPVVVPTADLSIEPGL